MDYEIWHDENKRNYNFCHGILLVPVCSKERLLEDLGRIRKQYNYEQNCKLKFAGCLSETKRGHFVSDNLILFQHILKSKNSSDNIYKKNRKAKYLKEYLSYLQLAESYHCKFGFLKIGNNMSNMYENMSYGNKVETTFRFITKSCLNSMFGDEDILIKRIIFDGYEHNHKKPDVNRLFKGKLKENIHISADVDIDCRQRDERDDSTGIIVDFIDNVVGSMEAKFPMIKDPNRVLQPLDEIYSRIVDNKIFSNPNSKWYKSIVCTEVVFDSENISFIKLPNKNEMQYKLLDLINKGDDEKD